MVVTAPREAPPAPGTRRVLGSPLSAVRQLTTTPGRLTVIAIGLVLLTVLTGLVGAIALQQKQTTIDNLVEHREPLAAAAQQLYRSLSDADATAASEFLSGGTKPGDRARYERDIAQAGAALARASADVGGDSQAEDQVRLLNQQLPIYAGLVESARANNRQGFPAGAAYLSEANGLMREKILPAANTLYQIDFVRLGAEQEDARSFPWATVALAVLLLAALIATQLYLTRRTNRLINIGLAVASVAVVLGLIWGAVALLFGSSAVADGERNGSAQVEVLVRARIVTLKLRADEILTLVTRGDGGSNYEDEFAKLRQQVSGGDETNLLVQAKNLASGEQVAGEIQAAIDNTNTYLAAYDRIRQADKIGNYQEAVDAAIKDAPDSEATAFAKLDENLLNALNAGRQEFLNQTLTARNALIGLVPGIVVLTLLAAAGITLGIAQRLREYR